MMRLLLVMFYTLVTALASFFEWAATGEAYGAP